MHPFRRRNLLPARNQFLTVVNHDARREKTIMRSFAVALILGLAGAPAAQAGAWLREKGGGFASTSVTSDEAGQISSSVYLEYGLSDRLTLGGDFYYGTDLTTFQEGSGIVFLRFPLGPTDGTHKWAAHVGAGTRYVNLEFLTAFEVGLSWGRGLQWKENYGWINVDLSFNDAQAPAERRVKLDGTVGMGLSERSKVMLQLFNTFEDGETYVKLAPSYLFTPRGGKTTLQIGLETPLAGGGEPTLKLGIWQTF
jgi:hypothetical protein